MKIVLFLFLYFSCAWAVDPHSPQLAVHLLSYIASDYEAAVQNGQVISQSEYEEQIEFAKTVEIAVSSNPLLTKNTEILSGMVTLKGLMDKKADQRQVGATCTRLRERIIQIAGIQVSPLHWPDQRNGKMLYEKNCASCHGTSGSGDGPSGSALNPPPTNFKSAKLDSISPFQAFNTIQLGVQGTGMPSFEMLSESEVWDLSFYVLSLRYPVTVPSGSESPLELALVATKSDADLKNLGMDANRIGQARVFSPSVSEGGILAARKKLSQALKEVEAEDRIAAHQSAIMAYLDGVEPIEPRLRNTHPALTIQLEQKMAEIRHSITAGSLESIQKLSQEANELLNQAETALAQTEMSPAMTFWLSSGLVLREGFEAVLILVTLLGIIRSIGSPSAAFAVHLGWIVALIFGAILWFFSGWVIKLSGANREILEGAISILAVFVLLYLGFWLHRRSEIGKWKAYLSERIKSALENKKIGQKFVLLASLSFIAVFREAFETVVFLRALLLDAGKSQEWALIAGVFASLAFVILLSTLLIRLSVRIPLKQLFMASSLIMLGLAFILIGKGIHSFQEAGYLPMSVIQSGIRIDFLGIYPSYESLVAQLGLLLCCGIFWIASRPLIPSEI